MYIPDVRATLKDKSNAKKIYKIETIEKYEKLFEKNQLLRMACILDPKIKGTSLTDEEIKLTIFFYFPTDDSETDAPILAGSYENKILSKFGARQSLILRGDKNRFRLKIGDFLNAPTEDVPLAKYWFAELGREYFGTIFELCGCSTGGSSSSERMNSRASDRLRRTSQNTKNLGSILTLKSFKRNHKSWYKAIITGALERWALVGL